MCRGILQVKEKNPQAAPDLVHTPLSTKNTLQYPAGTIRSAAGNATLLVVEFNQMQGIAEDFNKVLTAGNALMHRGTQNFH